MAQDEGGLLGSLASLPSRVAALVELISNLDQRVIASLDALDEMRTTVTGFDKLSTQGDELIGDMRPRIDKLDKRLNSEFDSIRATVDKWDERIDTELKEAKLLMARLNERVNRDLDEVKALVERFGVLPSDIQHLGNDLQGRVAALDLRLNRDLDDIKAAILAKIGDVDVAGLGPRIERLEAAVYNIERATVDLDTAFKGALEMAPGFMKRKLKGDLKEEEPIVPTSEDPTVTGI